MWGSSENSRQTDSVSNSVRELTDRWKKRQKTEGGRDEEQGTERETKRGRNQDGGRKEDAGGDVEVRKTRRRRLMEKDEKERMSK